jgi:hypothetical protein
MIPPKFYLIFFQISLKKDSNECYNFLRTIAFFQKRTAKIAGYNLTANFFIKKNESDFIDESKITLITLCTLSFSKKKFGYFFFNSK